MPFLVILENVGGPLEKRQCKSEEALHRTVLDLVKSMVSFHDGDVIRIVEVDADETSE